MISAKTLTDEYGIKYDDDNELIPIARAFLMSSGETKVVMARAMLEIMNG